MFEFRPLIKKDMKMLHEWLNTGNVLRYYAQNPHTLGEIKQMYLKYVNGISKAVAYIIYTGKIPIGFIKSYLIKDYKAYSKRVELDDNPGAFDLFIIDSYQGRGIGGEVIKQFIIEKIFVNNSIEEIVIGPNHKNLNAIKAYEKIGFVFLKCVKIPLETEEEYLMIFKRGWKFLTPVKKINNSES